jgi:hypothetical protein
MKHSPSEVMASAKPEKSNPVSTNGVTDTLSPCLRLLIEILDNEVTAHSSAVTALNETDFEKDASPSVA